jgi:hypothetical protein
MTEGLIICNILTVVFPYGLKNMLTVTEDIKIVSHNIVWGVLISGTLFVCKLFNIAVQVSINKLFESFQNCFEVLLWLYL